MPGSYATQPVAEAGTRRPAARPLRIALVHTHDWREVRRGGERYLSDLAWFLAQAGHTVEVIVSSERPTLRRERGATVVQTRRLQHPRLAERGIGANETLALSALSRLLRRRFDVVHCLLPSPVLAARMTGQRVVYTELGHPTVDWRSKQFGGLRLYRSVVGAASAVTALSDSAAQAVEDVAGRRAMVLAPGVRLDHFKPAAPKSPQPTVLFVSDASERRKGLDVAVAAFAELREQRPEARLVLAGPGDPSWALHPHPEVLDAVDVLGVGAREDLPKLYSSASVTILPSTEEAFGLALVESLACGTPVIASDTGGMRDIVTPEVGRLTAAGDATALASALGEMLDDGNSEQISARCRERARQWGWVEAVGPAHVELYRAVAR